MIIYVQDNIIIYMQDITIIYVSDIIILLRDYSSFDIMLLHLKLQTCHYNFIQHRTIIMPPEFLIK